MATEKNTAFALHPSIVVNGQMPIIKIQDVEHLRAESEKIQRVFETRQYRTGTEMRKARTQVNRLKRRVIRLQRRYHKPCMAPYKQLEKQVAYILAPVEETNQFFKKQLDVKTQQKRERLLTHWQPIMNKMCNKYGIQPFDFPEECLKLSLSKQKRAEELDYLVQQRAKHLRQQRATDMGGHAIDTKTGEVVGLFKKLNFVGSKDQLKLLLKFAAQNNITLREASEQ